MNKKIKNFLENFKSIIKSIYYIVKISYKYDKTYLLYYIPLILINTASPFITIVFPKLIIDAIVNGELLSYIIILIMSMFTFRFIINTVSQTFSYICSKRIINIRIKMRLSIVKKSMLIEYEQLERPSYLDMKARASQCIDNNYDIESIANNISSFISCILTLSGFIYIISRLNFLIVLLLIFVVIINSCAKSKQAEKTHYFRTKFSTIARKLFYIIGVTWDYKYAKDIRAYNLKTWLNNKKQDYLRQTSNNSIKIFILSTLISLLSILTSSIQQGVIYIYLIIIFFKGIITIGDFSMFLSTINNFSATLATIMGIYTSLSESALYLFDYIEFDKLKSAYTLNKTSSEIKEDKFELEFCDVSFKYPNQEQFALKNISIRITQNEKLSIVGENGAGKSTFVKLIMRLYKPTYGKILLNGQDIQTIDISTYTELISSVFQDYKILALSLKENIAGEKCEENRLNEILNKTGLNEKVQTLPYGIETQLSKEFDSNGIELSGGEQQKVAIAQALYKNTPIVIFDEPTSNLSPIAEYNLYHTYNSIVKNKIAIFISHRLSSCKFCDRIAVFSNGTIAECGTHIELLHKKGIYFEMFATQAKYYISAI